MSIGLKIKKIRESKNYSQEYVASKLGISQNAYSRIESNQIKIDIERIKILSEILETPIESIVSDDLNVFNIKHIERFYNYIENLQEENKELIENLNKNNEHFRIENKRLMDLLILLEKK